MICGFVVGVSGELKTGLFLDVIMSAAPSCVQLRIRVQVFGFQVTGRLE